MADKQPRSKRYSKTNTTNRTALVTMRLTNEELDAIDEIRDLGSFGTRAEVLRLLFRPSLKQFVTAIQTKSVVRAGIVKIEEEVAWNKKVRECMKAKDLQVEMFPELVEA